MDELLNALRSDKPDPDHIRQLADGLFMTRDGRVNWAQISEFASYAPCRIYPTRASCVSWLFGAIHYGGKTYYFGEKEKR